MVLIMSLFLYVYLEGMPIEEVCKLYANKKTTITAVTVVFVTPSGLTYCCVIPLKSMI
jgi:hypothetical protein